MRAPSNGSVTFENRDLVQLDEGEMRKLRGNRLAMIFQEPMTSLNPVLTVGHQIAESVRIHTGASAAQANARAVEMLRLVKIPDAERRLSDYPHQFSGGMRQRVMIATALACNPTLLIADEPTTALDVTIQAQILDLMLELKARTGAAVILITHNLGIVAETCARVIVMYAGRKIEEAATTELFDRPAHPYTRGLMASIPRLRAKNRKRRLAEIPGIVPSLREPIEGCAFAPRCAYAVARCRVEAPELRADRHRTCRRLPRGRARARIRPGRRMSPVVEVENLKKHFPLQRGLLARAVAMVKAVDGVSFAINPGETLCLVGESGCGKSTVGKVLLRLLEPTEGTIRLDGEDITHLGKGEMRPHRKRMQMVFQDPYASLNPRMAAGRIVSEPLENYSDISAKDRETRTAELFEKVGLRTDAMKRFPFEFSGGQRQRLGIARALALNPALIIADEPVSALDVSVQAQVLNLMMDLQEELGLAYLFVSHDLGVVEHIGHRVAVMYLGRIVEIAQKEALFETPLHPYTQALMAAAPIADPRVKRERIVLQGDVPSPINPPPGCTFHTRCPFAFERCKVETPVLKPAADGRSVACHLVD